MRLFLVAMLALALLAGCTSVPPVHVSGVPALPARSIDWSLHDCVFTAAVLQVPAAAVQPHVPPGFRVIPASEMAAEGASGLDVPSPPAADGNDGNLGVEAFQCASGMGLNGSVDGMAYASFFAAVEPPAALKKDGTPFYFVKWDVLVPDAARHDLLASYGMPVRTGNVSASLNLEAQSLAKVDARLEFGGLGNFSFDATALAPFPNDRCAFIEFTAVPAGLATWSMKCTFVTGGVGPVTVAVPPGSWFADIVGPGAHNGLAFIGRVEFAPGSLSLPATPGA